MVTMRSNQEGSDHSLPHSSRAELVPRLDHIPLGVDGLRDIENGEEHRHEKEHIGVGKFSSWASSVNGRVSESRISQKKKDKSDLRPNP